VVWGELSPCPLWTSRQPQTLPLAVEVCAPDCCPPVLRCSHQLLQSAERPTP
jgi:hypothetical protein